jgi:hypothetical protein
MHQQLRFWGLTGLLPPEREEQARKPKVSEARAERKARRGGGGAEKLPPAADAIDLFQAAIGRPKGDLAYMTHLEKVFQGGRFAQTLYYSKEAGMSTCTFATSSPPSDGKNCVPSRARTLLRPIRYTST